MRIIIFVIFLAVTLIHIAHALTLDRIIQYKEVTFYSHNFPVELNGYRAAFISDTHEISGERLTEIITVLNENPVDLLLLGGDYSIRTDTLRRTMEILSLAITTDGIYGVEGNHDCYSILFAIMEEYKIVPLSNSGLHIRENFFLAGVEDLWNRSPDIAAATAGSSPDDFVLLISHNPDIAMQQDTTGVDLIISGHTHAGQITFFGVWAPYFTFRRTITNYGQRFASGWASSHDGTPVFVSNGTGEYFPRIFARPQVIIFTFYNK